MIGGPVVRNPNAVLRRWRLRQMEADASRAPASGRPLADWHHHIDRRQALRHRTRNCTSHGLCDFTHSFFELDVNSLGAPAAILPCPCLRVRCRCGRANAFQRRLFDEQASSDPPPLSAWIEPHACFASCGRRDSTWRSECHGFLVPPQADSHVLSPRSTAQAD